MDIFWLDESFGVAFTFFIRAAVEISLLFFVVSFAVELLKQQVAGERLESLLKGSHAYFYAVALGAITPFCSCSTLPLMIGLINARARFGAVMAFLLTSPLLNPFVITLFWITFGYQVTLIYTLFVLVIAPLSGFLLQYFSFDRYIRQETIETRLEVQQVTTQKVLSWQTIARKVWRELLKFSPYMFAGVAIGAVIHGFVPQELLLRYTYSEPWWLIPLAAVIGVFLYIRASTMVPVASALIAKGVSLGAVMSLTVAGAGASLPEMIMMKRIFHWPLLLAFLVIVFSTACLTGVAINLLV